MAEKRTQTSGADAIANTKQKKKRIDFFSRKGFTLAFSLLFAVVLWFIMNYNTDDSTITLTNIPINISISDTASKEGIIIFRQEKTVGSVQVSGTGVVINSLTSDSVNLSAVLDADSSTLSDTSVSSTELTLSAKKDSELSNYTLGTVNPQKVKIYYDKYAEKDLQLDTNSLSLSAAEGYYISQTGVSSETINISGPASAVNRVSRIVLKCDENLTNLKESETVTCEIAALDENNEEIDLEENYLTLDRTEYVLKITVMSTKEVSITYTALNEPEGFNDKRISIEPSSVEIAAEAGTLEGISSLTLTEPIDFADITDETSSFQMEISVPQGVKIIGEDDETATMVNVTINLDGFEGRTISDIPSACITLNNIPEGKEAVILTTSFSLDVMGSSSQVKKLTSESVVGTIDLSGYSSLEEGINNLTNIPVSITLSGTTACWTTGTVAVDIRLSDIEEDIEPTDTDNDAAAAANTEESSESTLTPEDEISDGSEVSAAGESDTAAEESASDDT